MPIGTILSIVASAAAVVAPQLIAAVPHQYADIATAGIALVVALYHRFSPVPGSEK